MNPWWVVLFIGAAGIGWTVSFLGWKACIRSAIDKRGEKRALLDLPVQSKIGDPEIGEQVRYHNDAIYVDTRFFIKVSLAIVAGVGAGLFSAYAGLATHPSLRLGIAIVAAAIELLTGCYVFFSVLSHQKAKIVWWWRPPAVDEVSHWQETKVLPLLVGCSVGLASLILFVAAMMAKWTEQTIDGNDALSELHTVTSAVQRTTQSSWTDPAAVVGLVAFLGMFLISLALFFAYRKTNQLQQEFHDWQLSQISPEMGTGTFHLVRIVDGPTLRLNGVLLNPGSASIHLTHGFMLFDDKPALDCPAVFQDMAPEKRTIPGYGYLWLDGEFFVQHVSIRDDNYWPSSISLSIGYVSGGESKQWKAQLHRDKVVGEVGWYLEKNI